MKKDTVKIIIAAILLLAIIAFSTNFSVRELLFGSSKDVPEPIITKEVINTGDGTTTKVKTQHLRDKKLLYDDNNEVVTMYLTVRRGNDSEGTNHSWEEVNTYSAYYYNERKIDRYKVDALLQVGTDEGVPMGNLGYGRKAPNATVQIRGQTSSRNPQKNYKIELKKNQGSWNGQTTIALNKHMSDGLRFRNKMGYDLLKGIDQLMGLRTTFVHLYVNDLTSEEDLGFQDYGLYTQVEQLNKAALRAHGLDRTGHLYKINYFEFYRYEDVIKLSSDPTYDKHEFEQYLEIKGDEDHTKLIKMLDDLNDYSIPIEEILDKHFDVENLSYWMAFNILTGNFDAAARNAYLYSPQNLDTWYMYCWDIDSCFFSDELEIEKFNDAQSWETGISAYWGNILCQRALKSASFRKALDDAILDLKDYMNKDRLTKMVEDYRKVTDKYVYSEPDVNYAPLTPEEYDYVADNLPNLVDLYYEQYLESFKKPMPFFVGTPKMANDGMDYNWDNSYDFAQETVKYKAVVAKDLEFNEVVDRYEDYWPNFKGKKLEPGQYFLRVTATNESGLTQDCFDYYVTDRGKIYGTFSFYVNRDGSVVAYTVEE